MSFSYSSIISLDDATLRQLHNAVVSELNERQRMKARNAMRELRPGQKAFFINSRDGRRVNVVVEKLNSKTIGCIELRPDGTPNMLSRWRVSPTLLQAA